MKKVSTLTLILLAGAAQAGGIAPINSETPVFAPAPAAYAPVAANDWTGLYAGLSYSNGSLEAEMSSLSLDLLDVDGPGLHIGYLHDMGQWVLGGEFSYSSLTGKLSGDVADVFGDASSEADFTALKARIGYDAGQLMPYGVLGFGKLEEDNISEDATIVGIGAEYKVNQNFSIGAEYSRNIFKDILSDDLDALEEELEEEIPSLDATADLFSLRVSYHF